MKKISLLLMAVIATSVLYSQLTPVKPKSWCGTKEPPTGTQTTDGGIPSNPFITQSLVDPQGVIIIPVVFHIVYHTAAEKITFNRIQSQIQRLNTDFRNLNTEVANIPSVWANLPTDLKIEFRLACIDPNGNPTSGITETYTNVTEFWESWKVKRNSEGGEDAWPTNSYLNIWVYNIAPGAGFLGDATFPETYNMVLYGGLPNSLLDGITLDYEVVGDNNGHPTKGKGRTALHEAGHWLGLRHTYAGLQNCSWGDGIADTPPQAFPSENLCPTFPKTDDFCANTFPGVMFMNYMDLTSDPCRYMFTYGQSVFMRSLIEAPGTNSRFPFLNNYFGIKRFASTPYNLSNNILTVNIKNPTCLPTSYTYSGPVTEISHDDQKIIFSVPCGQNSMTLTATSGNYTDTYMFDFVNPQVCPAVIWPKMYYATEVHNLINDNFGNIFCYYNGDILTNTNHNGALPPSSGTCAMQYNTQTGITNWVKQDRAPLFALNSGDIQLKSLLPPYTTSFCNGVTGNPTVSPSLVPANEIIIAETSTGGFITLATHNINVHTNTGSSSTAFINNATGTDKIFFNPNSQKLFVEYEYYSSFNPVISVRTIAVYQLSNNTLTLINNPVFPASDNGQYVVSTNNNDIVYIYSYNSHQILQYDYTTNSYSPISIPGLTNSNLYHGYSSDKHSYTRDNLLIAKTDESNLYSINTITGQLKKTSYVYSSQFMSFPTYDYYYTGNDVYIMCEVESNSNNYFIIGNQTIPCPQLATSFITKFNLQSDFQFRGSSIDNFISQRAALSAPTTDAASSSLAIDDKGNKQVNVFPNPANSKVTITSGSDPINYIELSDIYNNIILRKSFGNAKSISFTVDNLNAGIYYCSIKTKGNSIITKKIVVIK